MGRFLSEIWKFPEIQGPEDSELCKADLPIHRNHFWFDVLSGDVVLTVTWQAPHAKYIYTRVYTCTSVHMYIYIYRYIYIYLYLCIICLSMFI